jgi:hypothetical protein
VQEDLQFTLILPPSRSCSGISWTLTNEKKKFTKNSGKKIKEKLLQNAHEKCRTHTRTHFE